MLIRKITISLMSLLVVLSTGCGDDKPTDTTPAGMPNPDGRLYVMNQSDNTVYIFDTKTFTRIDSFPSQIDAPHYMDFSPDGQNYYIVSLQQNGRVSKYDAATNAHLGFVQQGGTMFPSAIAITADNMFGYVCDFSEGIDRGKMYKFNLATMTLVDSIQSGAQSHDLKITSDGKYVIACNRNTEDVTIVDTQTDQVTVVPIDPDSLRPPTTSPTYGPFGVVIDHKDSLAFIATAMGDQVRVIDIATKTIVDSLLTPHIHSSRSPHGPTLMAVSPDNNTLFVTTQWANHLFALNITTGAVLAEIEFEIDRPFGVSISEDGSRVYVACVNIPTQLGRVYSIDGTTFKKVDSVDVGRNSMGLIWRPL